MLILCELKATGCFPNWQHLLHQSHFFWTRCLAPSHNSVVYNEIGFPASKFCEISQNEAVFELKLIPSPEKMQGQESETQPPPRTDRCLMAPLQPPLLLPSMGKIRHTSINTLRPTNKCKAKTYVVKTPANAGSCRAGLVFLSIASAVKFL